MDIIFKQIYSKLDCTWKSAHFIIRYALRNPPKGKGMGAHGVANEELIKAYAEGLEAIYQLMTSAPLNHLPPKPNRIEVFVFDTDSPFTYPDSSNGDPRNFIPYIALPSGTDKMLSKDELRYAKIVAAHEGAHAINFRYHPPFDPKTGLRNMRFQNWEWVDEGIAVNSETKILPSSREHYFYLRRWICQPEVPLDREGGLISYRAVMFTKFLDKLLKRPFANELWTLSKFDEDPFDALKRLLPDGYQFLSDQHDDNDVFAAYCLDSYFLADRQSCCYDQNLYKRFGERAITESFLIKPSQRCNGEGELDHLACSYYKIVPRNGVRKITVRLETIPYLTKTPLRAQLAKAIDGVRKGTPVKLKPVDGAHNTSKTVTLFGEMSLPRSIRANHLILVVSNHGVRPRRGTSHNKDHDDDQKFRFEISAE